MKKKQLSVIFTVLILGVGGCGYLQESKREEIQKIRQPSVETPTKITRDVLRRRLNLKSVDFIETAECDESASGENSGISEPVIKKAEAAPCDKPNPLVLYVEIIKGYRDSFKAQLNKEDYDLEGLISILDSIFKDRETKGVYRENTNEVEKRIRLAASDRDIADYEKNNVTVEDFERLVDDLRRAGIDQISVDFIGLPASWNISSSSSSQKIVRR